MRCYELLFEKGCELMGTRAENIQSPEKKRKETEETSTDSFHQGF